MALKGLAAYTRGLEREFDKTTEIMAGVILTRANMLAPQESGALKGTGRVEKNPEGGHSVLFGNENVRYARRRHYENKKNPQTLLYLEKAGDSVAKEGIRKYVGMSKL